MRLGPAYNASDTAAKIRTLRKETGDTKIQMAKRLGVHPNAYYKYERGEALPSFATLARLIDEFQVSMDWLLFHIGPRNIVNKPTDDALRQKIKNLETDLANERERIEDLTLDAAEYGEISDELDKPGVIDMLKYMSEDPSFYFKVMLYFREYQEQNKKPRKRKQKPND